MEYGAAFITDVGFCGAYGGVIGMDIETSLKRLITSIPERYNVAAIEKVEINGVRILINTKTGSAQSIKRIQYFTHISE